VGFFLPCEVIGWGERNANPNVSGVGYGAHVILHGGPASVGVRLRLTPTYEYRIAKNK